MREAARGAGGTATVALVALSLKGAVDIITWSRAAVGPFYIWTRHGRFCPRGQFLVHFHCTLDKIQSISLSLIVGKIQYDTGILVVALEATPTPKTRLFCCLQRGKAPQGHSASSTLPLPQSNPLAGSIGAAPRPRYRRAASLHCTLLVLHCAPDDE